MAMTDAALAANLAEVAGQLLIAVRESGVFWQGFLRESGIRIEF